MSADGKPASLKEAYDKLVAATEEKTSLSARERRARTVARLAAVQALYQMELAGEGVDMYFLKQALADDKPLLFLETVEQQLSMLLNISANNEDAFVQQNLQQLSELESELTKIIAAWRSGDTDTMAALAMAFTDTPEGKLFYEALLVQRNKNWLPQLEQMLATPEVELVLVGALHLAGEANVLQLLREQGYSITQL